MLQTSLKVQTSELRHQDLFHPHPPRLHHKLNENKNKKNELDFHVDQSFERQGTGCESRQFFLSLSSCFKDEL